MAMEVSEGTWLCEMALWVQWWHRGQLSAQGVCLYTFVDVAKFVRLVIETGGYSYMYLRTVGILMTAVMENMMSEDQENDLSIDEAGFLAPPPPPQPAPRKVFQVQCFKCFNTLETLETLPPP
ncbi:CngA [Symbiodinium natans]|uniref:CngA protein n=1 Tax=Symbiodinium natans TaxID=878477 RepID=A0A812UPB8_9DINO|nr:CngA [Symbiodinium natans]